MTANAALQDFVVGHEIDLRRFGNGVLYRMIAVLNRADARLAAALSEALMQMDAASFTVERMEALLISVRDINRQAYDAVEQALAPEMRALGSFETRAQLAALRAAIPAVVQLHFPIAAVSFEQVYAAAFSQPFQGRLLRGWFQALEEGRRRLINETVRAGFMDGLTTADIIRKLRGTKALRFEDGVLNRSRRELATIVQTALSHMAQTARQATVDANADLVKAVRWVSTLDSLTSAPCRIRDGLNYSADGKHKPLGHAIPWLGGPGRLHFNCRSVSAPVLKSWRELGIDADEMDPGERASMDGAVPADMTFAQWFARQSAARQDEIVGASRGALFRSGRLDFDRFYDDKGRWLTLAQLEATLP